MDAVMPQCVINTRTNGILRTEKSCGSDAPTLASSWWYDPSMMVAKEPGHQEEHEGPR
jgi:hypothetical protein